MFKRQRFLSSVVMRHTVLAIAGICFLTLAAGATSAAEFSLVDSIKGFLGLTGNPSQSSAAMPVDRPDAPLFTEDFAYAAGTALNGTGGWAAHSGAGTNAITVSAPGLTYSGYAGSGVGNSVTMTTTGEDDNHTYTTQTTGSVYAAIMVNISEASLDANGDYFFHLGPDPISTVFRARVYAKKDAGNNIAFGISKGAVVAPATANYTPFSYAMNQTHLLVAKYTIVDGATNDTVSLFVDPPLGGAEPASTVTATDLTATDMNPGSVALRQGSNATSPTLRADGIRVGTTWDDIAGGGGGTPIPTPTVTPGIPTPTPSPSPTPSPVASPSPTVPPVPFTAGDVVMYRVGDGAASLTNAATTVFLDEYTTSGTYVQSIRMPITANGSNKILTASGTSTAEGMLTRSTDGRFLVLTGYDKAPGGSNPSADPPATTNRVIGRVNASAAMNTATAMDDATGNVRSGASNDGANLWATTSSSGIRYTTDDTIGPSIQVSATPANMRATAIFSGQLYVSSASGAFQGIATVGTGLPTTSGQPTTLLNGFPTAAGPSPMQFAFFNANTLYVADDRATGSGGGVQKWTLSSGTWTLVNTFNSGLTAGCRGLTLTTNGSNQAVIYATTADSPSKLVTVTDDGTATPAFTPLATTGTNTAWRGVAFAPTGGGGATPTPGITPTPPATTPTPTPQASPTPSPSGAHTAFDFDGDHKTDISVWRSSAGQWWLDQSTAGTLGISFGESSDVPRAADYTGDTKTDVAFFRPADNSWYILRSEDFTYYAFPFGAAGDISVTGDFDGDGKADAAVYRPSAQTWFILRSSGGVSSIPFGLNGDIPVPADYDGDGKTDVAIYRPSLGQWWYLRSSDGGVFAATFGASTDKPVPGDYTGDHKADIAFFRPSETNWYVLRSEDFTYYAFPWGAGTDKPAPGDYDGDGKFDAAVFRPSDTVWYILKSSGGVTFTQFGLSNDTPVPGQSVP